MRGRPGTSENASEVRFGTKPATLTANTATSASVVALSGAGVVAATGGSATAPGVFIYLLG
ncbi:hypothetical protein ACWGGS_06255 [Streptomyces decoyicus]